MDDLTAGLLVVLGIVGVWIAASVVAARTAHRKGRPFGAWFVFALFMLPLAWPLSRWISDRSAERALRDFEKWDEPWDGEEWRVERDRLQASAEREERFRRDRRRERSERIVQQLEQFWRDTHTRRRRERSHRDRSRGVFDVVCELGDDGKRHCARCGASGFSFAYNEQRAREKGPSGGLGLAKITGSPLLGLVGGFVIHRLTRRLDGHHVCDTCGAGYPLV